MKWFIHRYHRSDQAVLRRMTRRLGAIRMPWLKDVFPKSAGQGWWCK